MPEYIVTSDVADFLAAKGFKVSPAYFKRIATPGQGKGPQAAGFWGNRKTIPPRNCFAGRMVASDQPGRKRRDQHFQ